MDFLRKLGVVKSGTQAWSGDAENRPADDPSETREMSEMEQKVDDSTENKSQD